MNREPGSIQSRLPLRSTITDMDFFRILRLLCTAGGQDGNRPCIFPVRQSIDIIHELIEPRNPIHFGNVVGSLKDIPELAAYVVESAQFGQIIGKASDQGIVVRGCRNDGYL